MASLPPSISSTSRVASRLAHRRSRVLACSTSPCLPIANPHIERTPCCFPFCMQLTARGISSGISSSYRLFNPLNGGTSNECSSMCGGAETVYLRGDMYRTRSYTIPSSNILYMSFLRLDESRHNIKAIPIRLQVNELVVYTMSCTTSPSSSFRDRAQ
jgi:hypothetical protein